MTTSDDPVREAAHAVLRGIISSGFGPAAPVFDEFDAAYEAGRGLWYKVDGAAVDALRAALEEDTQ